MSVRKFNLMPLPTLEAIREIHRGVNSVVSFAKRDDAGELRVKLGSINLGESCDLSPLDPFMNGDLYFSLGSTYQQRYFRVCEQTGWKVLSRKAKFLQYSNVVALDIDQHTPGKDFCFEDAFEMVISELIEAGIPAPSLVSDSGRGLWLFWCLCGRLDATQPPKAYPEIQRIIQRISKAAAKRFEHLGADQRIHDGSRLVRVPNSVNTAARGHRVKFYRITNAAYTISQLAKAFHVHARKTELRPERTGPKSERHVSAGLERWRVPLAGVRQLETMRGGFEKGTRRTGLWCVSVLLRKTRTSEKEILRECQEIAARCRPPASGEDAQDAIAASRNVKGRVSHGAFADLLKITRSERAALQEWFKPVRDSKARQIETRRKLIGRELASAPETSARGMVRLLLDRYQISVTRSTVRRDLAALASNPPMQRKGPQREEWVPAQEFTPMARQEQSGQGAWHV